jgi:hypothetical protein
MTRQPFSYFLKYFFSDRTCDEMGWESLKMWKQLSNQVSPWWKHAENESYIYYNKGDGKVRAGILAVRTGLRRDMHYLKLTINSRVYIYDTYPGFNGLMDTLSGI